MKKDQYILAIAGILDRESATLLLRELEALLRTGTQRITLDGRELGPALPEGVAVLRAGVAELTGELASDASRSPEASRNIKTVRIECVELDQHASAQFLLNDVAVDQRRALLWPPAGEDAQAAPDDHAFAPDFQGPGSAAVAQLGADGWLVDCWNCGHASRVRAAGEYACPVCGSPFRMLADGEVVTV